jgi:hypothetical protein
MIQQIDVFNVLAKIQFFFDPINHQVKKFTQCT